MCSGPFRYNTKLGAKWVKLVQLMQKFVPRKCVGIFRDKCTQSIPLDPKHLFWCVLYSLGAFGTILLPYETNFKMCRTGQLMQKFVPWNRVEIFRNKRSRSPHLILNSCFGAFRTRWVHLGPFCCLTKLISKQAELVQLMQKFVPWSRVRIFQNERTRSTPLYPKLMLWCVLYILDVFWTVWL
jgi:hypothetical protein